VQIEARRVHVLGARVAELDADLGLVRPFVVAEAHVAVEPEQRARIGDEDGGDLAQRIRGTRL
jgi:hypothetical protein